MLSNFQRVPFRGSNTCIDGPAAHIMLLHNRSNKSSVTCWIRIFLKLTEKNKQKMRLVQVLVVVTFLLVCFASATDSVHTWDWCELAHLPKMIDASTRRSGLVHFAQQFLFPINPTQVGNVTRQLYYVRLYAKEESYLRVAVAPTQHFDVGLYLHKEAEMLERGMNDATLISVC